MIFEIGGEATLVHVILCTVLKENQANNIPPGDSLWLGLIPCSVNTMLVSDQHHIKTGEKQIQIQYWPCEWNKCKQAWPALIYPMDNFRYKILEHDNVPLVLCFTFSFCPFHFIYSPIFIILLKLKTSYYDLIALWHDPSRRRPML